MYFISTDWKLMVSLLCHCQLEIIIIVMIIIIIPFRCLLIAKEDHVTNNISIIYQRYPETADCSIFLIIMLNYLVNTTYFPLSHETASKFINHFNSVQHKKLYKKALMMVSSSCQGCICNSHENICPQHLFPF